MIQNYEKLVERISKASDKEREEITRLVEAKRAKLSGLISREGAAQIVASELGINFEKEKMKINEVVPGMKKVNVLGKIIRIFPVHEYERKGKKNKVANMFIADDTGNIKTVLWDTNHISLIEKGKISEGNFVEISNASVRENELHLSGFSDIKKSKEVIDNVKTEKQYSEKAIKDFNIGGNFKCRSIVVQAFEPKFFQVCPECGKKVVNGSDGYECEKHGKVMPEKKALMNLVLDDGTGNIRAVVFSEQIKDLGFSKEELKPEKFENKKEEILGKEFFFSGRIQQNKLFNNLELVVSNANKVDIDKLISKLEK